MVKRSLSVVDGKLQIDPSIIRSRNPNEMARILKAFQKRYENGFSLESICEKLHFIFNWRTFEFIPFEDCLEKYLYMKNYCIKMSKGDPHQLEILRAIEGMIKKFEKEH